MSTLKITPALRWRKSVDFNFADPFKAGNLVLQQAWQDIFTGEITWKDVPMEEE